MNNIEGKIKQLRQELQGDLDKRELEYDEWCEKMEYDEWCNYDTTLAEADGVSQGHMEMLRNFIIQLEGLNNE